MSEHEIELGKRVFVEITRSLGPAVQVHFGQPSQGRYNVAFQGRKATKRMIDEDDLADLANNGGRKAAITLLIREALQEIGELGLA